MDRVLKRLLPLALAGAIVGALLAEFKPDLFGGMGEEITAAVTEPFDESRNEIALRWALYGAAIGGGIGAVLVALGGKA